MQKQRKIKLALIGHAGGHFDQLLNLKKFYDNYDRFWVTIKSRQTESALQNENVYYLGLAHFKKPWTYFFHFPQVLKIFKSEKPSHVISTGSGRIALVPFIVSKMLRIRFIYIETYSRVNNLTLFANFLIKLGHPVLTQWKNTHGKTTYIGPILSDMNASSINDFAEKHVFVTLGTRTEPFVRVLTAVESLVRQGIISEKVIVQAGYTKYESECMEIFDFCSAEEIDGYIQHAKYVITQESAGIGNKCLKYQKKFIVMPRDYSYGELPAKSDMKEDLHTRLEELGYIRVVHNSAELTQAIQNIEQLKIGFKFDNSYAISKLSELLEDRDENTVR